MYTWVSVFLYTRQAEADYYGYRRSSPSATFTALRPSSASDLECLDMRRPPLGSPPLLGQSDESDCCFKIDLCIFIYVYIKKGERGEGRAACCISWAILCAVVGGGS